jgi:hypothetical protein
MKMHLLLGILIGALLFSAPAEAADATSAWNSVAASYNFTEGPVPATWSFYNAYQGNNFEADFAGIMDAVAGIMGASSGLSGDDQMSVSLQNWPE